VTEKDADDAYGKIETPIPSESTKHQGLFGSAGIQLSPDEFQSGVTTKFLRHMNGTQELDIQRLRSFESRFYDKRQECEVLKKETELLQKEIASKKTLENVQKVMIASGSLLLGTLKLLSNVEWYVFVAVTIIAIYLILGGMFPALRIGAAK
jgi:hypothetical protein